MTHHRRGTTSTASGVFHRATDNRSWFPVWNQNLETLGVVGGFQTAKNKSDDTDFGIATNQYRCFDVFLPSKMTDSIASGRCGWPKPVVLFLIQFLLKAPDKTDLVTEPFFRIKRCT